MRYTVVLMPEEAGGYSVAVPAIPGCVTQGETVEEALARAADAAALILADMAESGEELPTELGSAVVAAIEVPLPALASAS